MKDPRRGSPLLPLPSSPGVSIRMSRQRRADTGPEMELRRLLHGEGLRYRVGTRVPGRPRRTIDIAFTRARLAVFVDGCFWHACPTHGTSPVANAAWWHAKLRRNVDRDQDTDEALAAAGWSVLRIWEHENPRQAASAVAGRLAELLQPEWPVHSSVCRPSPIYRWP